MRSRRHHEAGDTLVEILVAIVVIGITAIGSFFAISVGATTSKAQRDYVLADTVLRNAAEAVKQDARIDCTIANPQPLTIVYPSTLPANFTVTATGPGPAFATATCPSIASVSPITITVTLPDGTKKTLDVDVRTT